ncbi:MAG TPA: LLM class flavin-dependent oxidoreductase [Candidatus Dormibacteraeota bacterium]|jgi:probable F420-dependent oxidoreductase|nr:LLM class flavin-dependent oxidoreductase [Candidatus Dormibacteraeota bacterium]
MIRMIMVERQAGWGRTGVLLGSWPLGLPASGDYYRTLGRQVETLGYDMLFSGDHLFMYSPNPEAFTVLATYAAVTERILLGTGILLLALREPALVAKQVASIDWLSGGRMILGVGVGGEIEQEWRALEVPREDRGARTDEHLSLLRKLWSPEPVEHRGHFRTIEGVTGTPTPVQPGGPPIWIGGRSDAALQRAARHQGWCAYAVSPRRIAESVARIDEITGGRPDGYRISYVLFTAIAEHAEDARAQAAEVLGRRYRQDFDHFLDAFCAVGDVDTVLARIDEYRRAGVDDILICPQVRAEQVPDTVAMLAEALQLGA